MSPIPLGFWATAGAGAAGGVPAFELIATAESYGGSPTLTLSSIPSTYKHLQLRTILRTNRASTDDPVKIALNGDTSNSSYTYHAVGTQGNNTVVSTNYASGGGAARYISPAAGNSITASSFTPQIIDILDYTSSNYKTLRGLSGFGNGTSGTNWNELYSKLWMNTATVNSIELTAVVGTEFVAGSRISIYGVKG